MLPTQNQIELPLLEALVREGGAANVKRLRSMLRDAFPQITDSDLQQKRGNGERVWTNLIRFARLKLVKAGELKPSKVRSVYEISEQGRARLSAADRGTQAVPPGPLPGTREQLSILRDEHERAVRSDILKKLGRLDPYRFEHFARGLMTAYGFADAVVTERSGDGGIDGHGILKNRLASVHVAFQCKRWKGPVGRPQVNEFRGSIMGDFQHGVMFTPTGFSRPAEEIANKRGAIEITLVRGEQIVDLMFEKQYGVVRRSLEVYEDDVDGLFGDDADD